jgi:DNA polymerase III delta prime subunit
MLQSWSQLRSHAEQRELFRRSIVRGRMSHAYVFCGPSGIGKRQFARLLAKSLFCRECSNQQLDACVHQFKGSSASFGAAEMTKICIEFRNAYQNSDMSSCRGIATRMREAYGRLQAVLNEFERLEK